MDTTKKITKITYNGVNLPIDSSLEYLMRNTTPAGSKALLTQDGDGTLHAEIPDSVTSIGDEAFINNQLASVTIPNSVTSIGSYTFYNNKLTSVVIRDSVANIGPWAFYGNKLTRVVWETSVGIPSYAFYGSIKENTSFTITSDSLVSLASIDDFDGVTSEQPMTVYVQPQLIEDYKIATNWSDLYNDGRCDFVDIASAPTE